VNQESVCGAAIMGFPCQHKSAAHVVHAAEVPGFGVARWTDVDLFQNDGIVGALLRWKSTAKRGDLHVPAVMTAADYFRELGLESAGCNCFEIIDTDKTRHFKECPLRADFPTASTLPCDTCGGSGRKPL